MRGFWPQLWSQLALQLGSGDVQSIGSIHSSYSNGGTLTTVLSNRDKYGEASAVACTSPAGRGLSTIDSGVKI